MTVYCPFCGAEFEVGNELWAKQAICERCGRRFAIGQTPESNIKGIPRRKMTINESMKVAYSCRQMGDLITARRMTAETVAEYPLLCDV